MAANVKTAEMGRVMKIKKPLSEMIRDCRNAASIIGPRTSAKTSGAGSYSNFFIRYPTTPKNIMT